jgi:hypothetical protein
MLRIKVQNFQSELYNNTRNILSLLASIYIVQGLLANYMDFPIYS